MWLKRRMPLKPVGFALPIAISGFFRRLGTRSGCTCSYQSISPAFNAAAAVACSGMACHSTRSKCAIFPPEVQSAAPLAGM